MKKILSFILVTMLCCLNAAAQGPMLRINKTDGSTLVIAIDEVESIDFPEIYNLSLTTNKWCLHPGQQFHLELLITEEGSTCAIDADKWESSNSNVATVDANGVVTGVNEGVATITGCYNEGLASMQVKVTKDNAFTLNVTNITNTSCSYSIVPKDASTRYYCNMRLRHGEDYSIDSMEDHGSPEANIYYFTLDWYKFVADAYGDATKWNSIMQEQLEQGTKSGTSQDFFSSGLKPGETYALYALGFDEDGYLSTPVEMKEFTTTAPQKSDITFTVSINRCLSTDAQFTVTPSNNDPYLVCVQRANYVDWFIENDKVENMADPMIEIFARDSRYPALQRGTQTLLCSDFVNVRSNEDYYVIVFGYDDGQTSPITLKHFVTKSGWTDDQDNQEIIKVTPPANLVTHPCTIDAMDVVLDENDQEVRTPFDQMDGYIGHVGNDVYFEGVFGAISGDKMIKGTYNPTDKTVTFPYPQQLKEFDFSDGNGAQMVYCIGGNLDTGEMCDLIFDYDAEEKILRLRDGLAVVVNTQPFAPSPMFMMLEYTITLTEPLF